MKRNKIILMAVIAASAVVLYLGYTGLKPVAEGRLVWLDSLDLSLVDQAAGGALPGKSMWNTPLSIAGDTFSRGVGTHASGVIRIRLNKGSKLFQTKVGIDDSAPDAELKKASSVFFIVVDGKEVWRSDTLHAGDKAREVSIRLKGKKEMFLFSDATGDGIVGDRINWVDARFTVTGEDPYTFRREAGPEIILTPAESAIPKINPPFIHGATAGKPVLFTVPVTGKRPMRITATGLPAGLLLDPEKGQITGRVINRGTYRIIISASNDLGKDTRDLTLVIGDGIVLTPPMGWNSWNVFGCTVDQQKVKEAADAMVQSGLINHGFTYINIDDGWQGERGGKYGAIMPNEKFPDMKGLVEYIHKLGLKAGIYSSPWVTTYGGYRGSSGDNDKGVVFSEGKRTGKYSFAEADVKQWTEWGFDYLKYDWHPIDVEQTRLMSEILKNAPRDIVFSISNGASRDSAGEWAKYTNLWRTTFDINDSWYNLTAIGFSQDPWQSFARPGHWNDPDMLVIGYLGWGNPLHKTRLTPGEQYLHISLWSILAAPFILGCDLTKLDDFTRNLVTNPEVLAVNQDAGGMQGKRIGADKKRQVEIWCRNLESGSMAVGLFNLSEKEQEILLNFHELGIEGCCEARDIWRQKDLGSFNKSFAGIVPAHDVLLLKLTMKD